MFSVGAQREAEVSGVEKKKKSVAITYLQAFHKVQNPLRVRRESVFLEFKKRGIQTGLSAMSGNVWQSLSAWKRHQWP